MKNNQLTSMLLGLLLLSTLATVGLIYKYNASVHKMQRLQPDLVALNLFQQLYNDTMEYGKTHPDISHVFQPNTTGAKPTAPAASARPQPNK